jgi:hypothetical protein
MSFWGELKRRNVVKVGLAYAVVAWLLIQIASDFRRSRMGHADAHVRRDPGLSDGSRHCVGF